MRFYAVLIALVLVYSAPALAAKRVALVIGNDAYQEVTPLQKAKGDAQAISQKVAKEGFEVITLLDGSRRQIAQEFSKFTGLLEPGDTAMIFFAGHGVEIDGENYLLPVDIAAPSSGGEDFVKFESFALSDLLDRVRATGARTTLAFLDACRDNPFASSTAGRSIGRSRGLGRIAAPEGTFVVYSAGAGQQALDALGAEDNNQNSVFTRLLLPKLSTPGLELRNLISELRVEVRDLARTQSHEQFPAYYDELLGEFYFAGVKPSPAPLVEQSAPQPPESEANASGTIRADFALARELGSESALRAFISTYEDSDDFTVSVARSMLEDLTEQADPVTESSETETPTAPAKEEPQDDTRALIRQSQARLNALGCNAGGADGIAGRKTRAAFSNFISESAAELRSSDLGSQRALDALNSASGTVCKPPTRTQTAAVSTGSPSAAARFIGTWDFRASCPLFIKSVGVNVIRQGSGGTLRSSLRDNLGNSATSVLQVSGSNIFGTESWHTGLKTNFNATISADGRTMTGNGGVGCKVTATKR